MVCLFTTEELGSHVLGHACCVSKKKINTLSIFESLKGLHIAHTVRSSMRVSVAIFCFSGSFATSS